MGTALTGPRRGVDARAPVEARQVVDGVDLVDPGPEAVELPGADGTTHSREPITPDAPVLTNPKMTEWTWS